VLNHRLQFNISEFDENGYFVPNIRHAKVPTKYEEWEQSKIIARLLRKWLRIITVIEGSDRGLADLYHSGWWAF